jgi:hypothetical protein
MRKGTGKRKSELATAVEVEMAVAVAVREVGRRTTSDLLIARGAIGGFL